MYLHFSPRQNNSGVLVYHHQGLTLNLLVLPKMWKPQQDRVNPWDFSKETLQIVAYEGERHLLHLEKKIPLHQDWKQLLTRCCNMLSSKSVATQDNQDEQDDGFDAETLTSLSGLMTKISQPSTKSLTSWLSDSSTQESENNWVTQVEQLFNLAFYCDTHKELNTHIFQNNDASVVALTENVDQQTDSPIFKILAIENFLVEIEQHLHKIHQGYLNTTERRDSIRGSVTGTSLMLLDAGVSLKPECRYNKFVPNIPLYQVLITTLDAIYKGWCIPQLPFIRQLKRVDPLKETAKRLRHQLQHISSLPLEVARHTGQRLHLNRLQLFWKPALNLSNILLRNKPVFLEDTVSGNGGYMWIVSTAAVWESILAQALRTQFQDNDERVLTHVQSEQPWTGLSGNPDADIVVSTQNRLYIFDAKYKINGREDRKSSKGEEYQMFAYSHLITKHKEQLFDQPKRHIGLVYPTFNATYSKGPHNRGGMIAESKSCILSTYYLNFPQPNDLDDEGLWKNCMKSIGKEWKNCLPSTTE